VNKTTAQAFVPLGLTLTLLCWPLLSWLHLRFSKRHVGAAFVLTFCILFSVDCDTAPLALACGLGTMGLFWVWPQGVKKMMYVITTLAILTTPFFVKQYVDQPFITAVNQKIKSHSYIHRLYIMKAVSSHISNKWFLGHGLDSSRHPLFGKIQPLEIIGKNGSYISHCKEIPTHPHNATLQWWLELGGIGAFLACLVNIFILRSMPNTRTFPCLCLVGLYTSSQVIALINLGFWQNWWLAILMLAASLCLRLTNFGKN
jgi:O-antigen ligase